MDTDYFQRFCPGERLNDFIGITNQCLKNLLIDEFILNHEDSSFFNKWIKCVFFFRHNEHPPLYLWFLHIRIKDSNS